MALEAVMVVGVMALALLLRPWRALPLAGPPWPWLGWCAVMPLLWGADQVSHVPLLQPLSGACLLALMAGWPLALLFPVAVPLGLGQVWERVEDALTLALDGTAFEQWIPMRSFELEPLLPGAELLCVVLGFLIPCLLGFGVIRQLGQRVVYLVVVLACGLGVSALSATLSYGPSHAWSWLGVPVVWGLVCGCILSLFFVMLSARTCWVFLLLALLVQQSVLNQSPESAYFAQTLQTWEQGRFIRFNGLVQWLGWLWPYTVLLYAISRLTDAGRDNSHEI